MPRHDKQRQRVIDAKRERRRALHANAEAAIFGREPVFSEAELQDLRSAVRRAMSSARQTGCNIDDLVGPQAADSA